MKHRTVQLSPQYQESLKALCRKNPIADAYHKALEWSLARNAEQGFSVRGRSHLRVWPFHVEDQRFAVHYKFDSETVTLLELFSVPDEANRWGRD